MLRFAEELLIFVLDEGHGELAPGQSESSLYLALAGAVLMDLALEGRIDTDLKRLWLVDSTPLGEEILDPTLAVIAGAEQTYDTGYWLERTAQMGDRIRDAALAHLTERGILRSEAHGLLSLAPRVSRTRRYPVADGKWVEETRLRIMRLLFSDDIPDPRDPGIIALADACGMLRSILSPDEYAQVRGRIDVLQNLDLIAQAMGRAIQELSKPGEPSARSTQLEEIPVVPGLPLLGNSLALRKGLVAFLCHQYRRLGPIFRIRTPGRRFVCMVGPEATNFLASHGKAVFRSLEPMANFHNQMGASRSILTMDGVDHVTMRKVQGRGYAAKVVKDSSVEVVDIVRNKISKWPVGKPFEALPAIQSIIVEQMGYMMADYSPRGYTKTLATVLSGLLLSSSVFPNIMKLPRFRRARARSFELAEKVLAHKEQFGPRKNRRDFMDLMLELREVDPQLVPETNMPLNVLAPYLVGLDTTAATCVFMLYNILKRPEIMRRMTAEADAIFYRGMELGEGLRQLDVTRRVAMETLRLHPVSPAVLRTVSNSFEFANYRVPAGSLVLIGTAVGHGLEEYFPEPERFDIDRYSQPRAEHRQRDAYVPFGAGVHRCLGSGLVPIQLGFTIATILHELILQPLDTDYKIRVRSLPTTQPSGFKICVLGRRSHDNSAMK